jgi:uncharacterized protein YbaR (Trm112 family)
MAASRIHGQHGALYCDVSSAATGSAILVATLNDSKRSFQTATVDVTAYEDPNLVYVAGKPDASTTYTGFLDVNSDQLWYPSRDGVPRKFYDYVDTVGNPNKYWFGTGIFDFGVDQGVSAAVSINITMKAASAINRVWA